MHLFLFFSLIYIIDLGQTKTSAATIFLIYQLCSKTFVFKDLTFSPSGTVSFGSLAVDPVGGALNYVIALLLPPILMNK
jgi:hypothetical protein